MAAAAMDIPANRLHYSDMNNSRRSIPSYRLYGEKYNDSIDFWIHCESIPERTHLHNFEIERHRHDGFFQIFCIEAGGGEIVGADGVTEFQAPCALFIPPGAVHGFRFARDVDGFVLTALADRLASPVAADRRIARFAEQPRIVGLPEAQSGRAARSALEAVRSEIAMPGIGRAVLLEAHVTAAIVALARCAENSVPRTDMPGERDTARMEKLLQLIAAHYREQKPVAFYAERIGMSSTHLNRLARAQLGNTVQGLIAQRVLEAARRDLIFTPTPVQTIAYALGFADPAYFNRFFRRMAGTTPGAYRRAERSRLAV